MNEDDYERQGELTEETQYWQLIGFVLGKTTFGVDILSVKEIIREVPVTLVPNAPDFIDGVINLRGTIIPIIDLRKRLDLREGRSGLDNDGVMVPTERKWILVLDIDGRVTGFLVDHVTQVMRADRAAVEQPPEIVVAGLERQYILGIIEIESQLVILLDFDRVLAADEIRKLKRLERESETG